MRISESVCFVLEKNNKQSIVQKTTFLTLIFVEYCNSRFATFKDFNTALISCVKDLNPDNIVEVDDFLSELTSRLEELGCQYAFRGCNGMFVKTDFPTVRQMICTFDPLANIIRIDN